MHTDEHAIEVADFVITFGVGLDSSDIARLDEAADEIADIFPAMDVPQSFHIAFGQPSNAQPPQVRRLTFFGNDGQPIWVAEFGRNQIVLSCHKYTKWMEIWPEAQNRLNRLLDCVDELKPVLAIEYRVTDTFRAQLQDNALTSSVIFSESPEIPTFLLDLTDPRWDISHGRFKKNEIPGEVLERIEASSSIENDNVVVRIGNLQSQRIASTRLREVRDLKNPNGLEVIFSKLHDDNKITLISILQNELCQKMGLLDA